MKTERPQRKVRTLLLKEGVWQHDASKLGDQLKVWGHRVPKSLLTVWKEKKKIVHFMLKPSLN